MIFHLLLPMKDQDGLEYKEVHYWWSANTTVSWLHGFSLTARSVEVERAQQTYIVYALAWTKLFVFPRIGKLQFFLFCRLHRLSVLSQRCNDIGNKDCVCGEYGCYSSIVGVACEPNELKTSMIDEQGFDIPFQRYFSVTKYNVMGTIPKDKLKIMSLTRTPLYKPVRRRAG
jgi:hypothetical protein